MQDTQHSHMKVVVIDDDAMILRSLKAALAEFEFQATTFEDPIKALDWIEENGADIVISDIRMPRHDGFEVLKRLKEIDPQCELIFITAHGQLETAIRALREGATDFFEKPFTTSALTAAIERTTRFRVLARQRQLLAEQVNLLNDELTSRREAEGIMIGQSNTMKAIVSEIVDVSQSSATVLLAGESGTGKELAARALHHASPRAENTFLTLNCASVPEDLFESEMFGHRRGAFTGAVESRGGYVDTARGGTLFLDEISELPPAAQAKILRLLEEKTYLPLGEREERDADVRIVTATNKPLEDLVRDRKFREDLYHRLMVCKIVLPPLRERKEDIPLLALYFTLRFAADMGKTIESISDDAMDILLDYDYPGNVRELRNIIEGTVIRSKSSGSLTREELAAQFQSRGASLSGARTGSWPLDSLKFEEVERRLLREALERTGKNVSAAARLMGLSRGKLRRRMAALGLSE
ncbi:MAG: sigma-54 dependent transcriptional regulator [Kiritimatiellia bacterium]